jgi:hypothetical protein
MRPLALTFQPGSPANFARLPFPASCRVVVADFPFSAARLADIRLQDLPNPFDRILFGLDFGVNIRHSLRIPRDQQVTLILKTAQFFAQPVQV